MKRPTTGTCWHCGGPLGELEYGRQDSCPKCRRDTHVCRNCGFYDPAYNNQCREPQADRVAEKERSNFCDYFQPRTHAGGAGPNPDSVRAAAEALFKKK